MRKLVQILGLELYALALAAFQFAAGIHTDEAKYLLDIPYPHPPLGRGILHLLEWLPCQDCVWRIVLATLVVQAVWLVSVAARNLPRRKRLALAASWLFAAAVLLQAGTIMMAPITALFGLVFCVLAVRPDITERMHPVWVGILWLASLLVAYQGVLYLPLVVLVLWRRRPSVWLQLVAVGLPLLVLTVYTFSNPLALASMVSAGTLNHNQTTIEKLHGLLYVWALGGSMVLGPFALVGIILARRWMMLLSLILVSAYVALSFHEYYAILLTPLFVVGSIEALRRWKLPSFILPLTVAILSAALLRNAWTATKAIAPEVLSTINLQPSAGDLLINGSFGHEWQYESPVPVRRYRKELVTDAQVIICLQPCTDVPAKTWQQVTGLAAEVWIRK